ncbi:MAG: hypothetical protein ACREVE_13760 [Gammaproteobacteria bacterium]
MKKGILLCAMLMVGCVTSPPRNYWIEQPKDDLYLADPDAPTERGVFHIVPDGFDGYWLPGGGHITPDGFGGYYTPNGGHVVPDGYGGYFNY